jgi:hypothetical protein
MSISRPGRGCRAYWIKVNTWARSAPFTRVLSEHGEIKERRLQAKRGKHAAPVLEETAPNQVWTDAPGAYPRTMESELFMESVNFMVNRNVSWADKNEMNSNAGFHIFTPWPRNFIELAFVPH